MLSNKLNFNIMNIQKFDRAAHMRELHANGRYAGTSKIGAWNVSKEKQDRMKAIRERNLLDKSSHGYGSEYHMRLANKTLLGNKFQGETGFLYFLDFPGSVKVGFSKDWEKRTSKQLFHQYIGGKVIMIISGPTNELAELEFNTMIKFQDFTKLDETGTRYTEFIDKKERKNIYNYLLSEVDKNKNLKLEILNNIR